MLGREMVSVQADTWTMPWNDEAWGMKSAVCTFRADNGARITFRGLATDQPGQAYPGTWVVEGTEGVARMEDNAIWLDDARLWPEPGAEPPGLDLGALNAEVLRQTVAYVKGGAAPSITGRDNLSSLSMVFGSIRASETGCAQPLSERS
jgi:predicted dehydrogenase